MKKILLINPISRLFTNRFLHLEADNDWSFTLLVTTKNIKEYQDIQHQVVEIDSLEVDFTHILGLLPEKSYDAVVPVTEFAVPLSEYLAKALGTYHNPTHLVRAYRDKFEMRNLLQKNGVKQPKLFGSVASLADFDKLEIDAKDFPVIVKPSDMAGSAFVQVCYDQEEARVLISKILEYKESIYTNKKFKGEALVEQLILGREYSAEVLISGSYIQTFITQKYVSPYPYCNEVAHVVPALVSSSLRESIEAEVSRIVAAFQVRSGLMHAEFKVHDEEAYLIEAGLRAPGDRITEISLYQYGFRLEELLIRSRLNELRLPVTVKDDKQQHAVSFIFSEADLLELPRFAEVLEKDVPSLTQKGHSYAIGERLGSVIMKGDLQKVNLSDHFDARFPAPTPVQGNLK